MRDCSVIWGRLLARELVPPSVGETWESVKCKLTGLAAQ
jgi:hypothetical protein